MPLTRHLHLDLPADRAFAALTDIAAIPEWISTITAARITSPPPLAPGSRFTQQARLLGRSFPIDGVVLEHRAPHRFAYRYDRGIVAGTWLYELHPADRGCRLDVTVAFTGSPLLRPLTMLVVSRNIDSFGRWAEERYRNGA